jgi:hypothetical protein
MMLASLVLAAGAGLFAASSLGVGTAGPAQTVTVTIPPPAPPSAFECPEGFSQGALVVNHPGGQVTLWSCLKEGSN